MPNSTKWEIPYPALDGIGVSADVPATVKAVIDRLEIRMAGYQEGTLGTRPVAGKEGLIYYSTDTEEIYLDIGSAWIAVGGLTPASTGGGALNIDGLESEGDIWFSDQARGPILEDRNTTKKYRLKIVNGDIQTEEVT